MKWTGWMFVVGGLLFALGACGDDDADDEPPPGAPLDGGELDAGDGMDGGPGDAGSPVDDAGPPDAGPLPDGAVPTVTETIPLVCRNSFNQALSEVPARLRVEPSGLEAGEPFDAEMEVTLALGQEFLQGAADALGEFGLAFEEVTVDSAQVEVRAVAGASGDPLLLELTETPAVLSIPIEPGTEGMVPTTVTGDVSFGLPARTGSFEAGDAGETIVFCPAGDVPDSVEVGTDPMQTYLEVEVSILAVDFACEPGTVDDGGTPDDGEDDTIVPIEPEEDCVTFALE